MEEAALAVSIVSICISLIVMAIEIHSNKKLNDINLEAELSKDIVKGYLTKKFPQAISDIYFNEKKLTNIDSLQNALNSLRNELRFFKYSDPEFYGDLKMKTQEIEDYIVENEDCYFEYCEQIEVKAVIHKKTTELYALLNNKYKNG